MDRRAALMALVSIPLTQLRLTREPGVLTIDLNQWIAIVVKHGTHEVEIPVATIFAELTRANDA